MADRTAAERMARKRRKDREEKGVVEVSVRVHHTRREEIRRIAAAMREPVSDEKAADGQAAAPGVPLALLSSWE